jgi:hypothetical protein
MLVDVRLLVVVPIEGVVVPEELPPVSIVRATAAFAARVTELQPGFLDLTATPFDPTVIATPLPVGLVQALTGTGIEPPPALTGACTGDEAGEQTHTGDGVEAEVEQSADTHTMTICTETKINRKLTPRCFGIHLPRANNTSCVCRIQFC